MKDFTTARNLCAQPKQVLLLHKHVKPCQNMQEAKFESLTVKTPVSKLKFRESKHETF